MIRIVINEEKCKGCLLCQAECRNNVIRQGNQANSKGYYYMEAVNAEACVGCKLCAIVCPDAAIELFKEDE